MKRLFSTLTVIVAAATLNIESYAQESTRADSEVLFVRRIGPLLREKCLGCHGNDPAEIEGSLDVRSMAGLLAGGDSSDPSIVAGKPDESPLYLAATRQSNDWSEMPPKEAEQLSAEQLTWLRDWIKSGAKWPSTQRQEAIHKKYAEAWSVEDGISVATSGGLSPDWTNRKYDPAGLWAYQPVTKVNVKGKRNPIDVLIDNALPAGLAVAPRADRRTLIRRTTFDLTGLPPTPREVEAFMNDATSDGEAFSRVVDRLLASPHYGERMAQHWLDVVRYADSSGFANDFERGNAWRYRDYVVRSFNDDKPYDRFVREQIAGDELDANNPEMIVATGFLRMGPWELTFMEVPKIARQRFLDDVTNGVGETFLAHSLQCARCHDHKFDPVPTKDYYSIQAVFATTQLAERKASFLKKENTSGFEEQSHLKKLEQTHQQTLAELDCVLLGNAQRWYRAKGTSSVKWDESIEKSKADGRTVGFFDAARLALRKAGVAQNEYPPKLVGFTPEQFGRDRVARKGLQRLGWEFERYKPYALSVYNGRTKSVGSVTAPTRIPNDRMKRGELEQTAILTGGDPFSAGRPVSPGTLSVINGQVAATIPKTIEGRRTGFAHWVADSKNPLTTRTIANRLWLWHFGEAIAGNPNNFGSTGKRPTHPRLLDWLAATLVEDNWSIKAMHRRIMMSDAYCRSSHHPDLASLRERDPKGISYAVFKPRRLTAEELRDSMLAVTKELNSTIGGIPCRPEINVEVAMQPRQVMGTFAAAWVPNPRPSERHRRSIYVLKLRGLPHPMLEVFNSPAPDFSCERREASTVTPQVFSLLNSQNSYSRGLALADRAWREAAGSDAAQRDAVALERCFELALCRRPSANELKQFLTHWTQLESELPAEARPSPTVLLKVKREAIEENTGERFTFEEPLFANEEFESDLRPTDVDRHVRALGDVCLVILNSNEFVYVY